MKRLLIVGLLLSSSSFARAQEIPAPYQLEQPTPQLTTLYDRDGKTPSPDWNLLLRPAGSINTGWSSAAGPCLTWAHERRVTLRLIEPGKPNQNACVESFSGRFRDECLNEHWFTTSPTREVVFVEPR